MYTSVVISQHSLTRVNVQFSTLLIHLGQKHHCAVPILCIIIEHLSLCVCSLSVYTYVPRYILLLCPFRPAVSRLITGSRFPKTLDLFRVENWSSHWLSRQNLDF